MLVKQRDGGACLIKLLSKLLEALRGSLCSWGSGAVVVVEWGFFECCLRLVGVLCSWGGGALAVAESSFFECSLRLGGFLFVRGAVGRWGWLNRATLGYLALLEARGTFVALWCNRMVVKLSCFGCSVLLEPPPALFARGTVERWFS